MPRPFEVKLDYLRDHLAEMVAATFADLESQFLVLPRGAKYIEYGRFQDAYEVLKHHTAAFSAFRDNAVWAALREDSLTFLVVRAILGMTQPEWAELARWDRGSDISQGYARQLDGRCRTEPGYFGRLRRPRDAKALERTEALVQVAVEYINQGAPSGAEDTVHRLDKVDTREGSESLQYVAAQHIPYAVLLYERYLGRPFASHRDSVSRLVGEVMESAIEERLHREGITFRKVRHARPIQGFTQLPDFFVPDEYNPAVLIEAKISGDDGTARDKVARIERLAENRNSRRRQGEAGFELVACIDGRGFGVRGEDMRKLLLATEGKVFTLATLDQLIPHTRLREFLPVRSPGT